MILSRSSELIEKCWAYCNQGRKRSGGWFDHYTLGSNYRITGFQSAILCEQLKRNPQQTTLRAANVARFRKGLKDIPGLTLVEDDPRIEQNPYYLITLRYQPESALATWFKERLSGAKGRLKKVLLVALARKLLIALWRYATNGVVPQGAVLKPA